MATSVKAGGVGALLGWRVTILTIFLGAFSGALIGIALEAGQKPIGNLNRIGVDVRRATIEAIHPQEKSATVDGERIQADALIVALGAELIPNAVTGFKEYAFNVYDPDDIPRAEK